MTTKQILRDSATFTIRTVAPDGYDISDGVNINITDPAGTVLDDNQSCTVAASATLDATAYAGRRSLVLADAVGLHEPDVGEHFRVGSDSQGWQYLTVASYVSASRAITTKEFLSQAFSSGSAVEWRDITYEVDTTGSEWDNIGEVTLEFVPMLDDDPSPVQHPDYVPWTELWTVVKRTASIGAFESQFREAYPSYHEVIADGGFASHSERAQQRLRNYFEAQGRDFAKVIDSEIIREPWMVQIALLIANARGESYDGERVVLKQDLDDLLARIDSLPIWVDANQDKIQGEDETATADPPGLGRGL